MTWSNVTSQPIFGAVSISKVFPPTDRPFTALHEVSLEVNEGEALGIIGGSGAGKTTFGRIAVGLETPTSGAIYICGERIDLLRTRERRRRFLGSQMIFQDPFSSLNPNLTIGRQIGEGIFARGVLDWRQITHEVIGLLEKVGLTRAHADCYPNEFSGGQRQRIAIARALAPGPTLLVADEPVSALDARIQAQILDLMEEIMRTSLLSCILISHDMSVIARLCDRVAVIHQGRVVEVGPVQAVIEQPQHPQTKKLLDGVLRVGRRRSGRLALTGEGPGLVEDRLVETSTGHWVSESAAK